MARSEKERARCGIEDDVRCDDCQGNTCPICNWGCRGAIAVHVYCDRCETFVKNKGELEFDVFRAPDPTIPASAFFFEALERVINTTDAQWSAFSHAS